MMDLTAFDVALNFHGIGKPGRTLEVGEEICWISEAFFRDVLQLIARHAKHTLITFDDGNASDIEIAAPLLQSLGLTAIFFVLAGRLGQPGSLTAQDVQKLSAMGMEIGNHGYDQVDWKGLNTNELELQLTEARQILEKLTGKPVTAIGIPYGSYNRRTILAIRQHGYKYIFTSDGGPRRKNWPVIPRYSLRSSMTLKDVENILTGTETLGRSIRRSVSMAKKRWL